MYSRLRCPKRLAIAPNRAHAETGRRELENLANWVSYAVFDGPAVPRAQEGTLQQVDGRLVYRFGLDASATPKSIEVYYAYLFAGDWLTCVWHRRPAKLTEAGSYEAEIPVYDPEASIGVFAQIQNAESECVANTPRLFVPREYGVTKPSATYPKTLIDFADRDDLYLREAGSVRYVPGVSEGSYAAEVTPFADGAVELVNFETPLWTNPKELVLVLKGDGKPGPLVLWFLAKRVYRDAPREDSARYTLIGRDEVFSDQWKEYHIPVKDIPDFANFRFLAFDLRERPGLTLGLEAVRWQ